MTGVILIDDSEDFCVTARDFLDQSREIRFLGYACEVGAFKTLLEKTRPDIALIDLGLPDWKDGLELLKYMKEKHPDVASVVLTAHDQLILRSYRLGVRGFHSKSHLENLAKTLVDVTQGRIVIPPELGEVFVDQLEASLTAYEEKSKLEVFTKRELEIVELIRKNLTRREIGDVLCISVHTVKRHINHILQKTEVSSVRELAALLNQKSLNSLN